mgnify:FL=1
MPRRSRSLLAVGEPGLPFVARRAKKGQSFTQGSKPAHFKIYWDGGSGEIDYENPMAAIHYAGQIFYSHLSDILTAGKYLFCIKAEDAGGVEDGSYSLLEIQLDNKSPDSADILSVEAV